jgi:hypothetical protein
MKKGDSSGQIKGRKRQSAVTNANASLGCYQMSFGDPTDEARSGRSSLAVKFTRTDG